MIRQSEIQAAVQVQAVGWAQDATAFKAAAMFQLLPELRGFWPFSSVDESSNIRDLSGQGRTLSNNGTSPRSILTSGVPFTAFNGSSQYLSRPDETGLDITGGLTMGGWFFANGLNLMYDFMGKGDNTSLSNTSYLLQWRGDLTNDPIWAYAIDAAATGSVAAVCPSSLALKWHHIVYKFQPSTELSITVNGIKYSNTTNIPAALRNSAAPFTIGANAAPARFLPGAATLCFLCAAALPDDLINGLYAATAPLFG